MARYVLTQEQLDHLQEQIQELTRLNNSKELRIRELEHHKVSVSGADNAELIRIIGRLEDKINELLRANQLLKSNAKEGEENAATRIKELEKLLEEERRLRKYSEAFAKQVEVKCAEESLIRELTTELCQLQKAEIEIDNKRIEDLQKKIKHIKGEPITYHRESPSIPNKVNLEKEKKQTTNTWHKENNAKHVQMKMIIEQLKSQLSELLKDIEKNPVKSKEEHQRIKEVEKWLSEATHLMADLNGIESLNSNLNYMKNEIENRKKSFTHN